MSNNSVVCDDISDLHEFFWDGYEGKGEPYGLINLKLSRKIGRLGETQYPDPAVQGYNPCLHPDTLVSTIYGQKRIADITEPTYVYTMMEDGRLGIKKATASWISKKNAKTINVRINSGVVVKCTPDHKIFSVTRGWVEAQDLRIGERVVHLARTRRGSQYSGVRLTSQPVKEQVMEHRLVWEGVFGPIPEDHDIHHIDGNTHNNNIENLECLSHSSHSSLTRYECPNDHQVHGENGDFISTNSGYVKPIINVPTELRTGLTNWPLVVAIEEGETTDVYDMTVEDTHNFVANNIIVHNCAEQSLANFETCCLAEVFLPNVTSKEELIDICKMLYRINKHSLRLPCHLPETEKIVHENMRMGIGLTGVLQASEEQISWLDETYKALRKFDEEYSFDKGWNKSIKLTTIKPSGTLSLLPGVTPGIHPGYAQYMIRRIRIASNHPLVETCRQHGYPVEYQRNFDGSEDRSTMVVSFPFSYPEGTKLAKDMTAIDQLEQVKRMQTLWSDNSVSCTVYYRKEELPEIQKYLKKYYKNHHKSLSFLLHSDHGFHQAPYEEITKEAFDELKAQTTLIISISEANIGIDDDCASGACPVR
jgi:ribonucleotide reductase alpha subunit